MSNYKFNIDNLTLTDMYQIVQFALSVSKTEAGYYSKFLYDAAVQAGFVMTCLEDNSEFVGMDVLEVCQKFENNDEFDDAFGMMEVNCVYNAFIEMAEAEFDAAVAYNNSTVCGINAIIDTFGKLFGELSGKVDGMIDNEQVKAVLDIASAYGMNNKTE